MNAAPVSYTHLGPDFDGHEVDFDGAMRRLSMYDGLKEREEDCRLIKMAEEK